MTAQQQAVEWALESDEGLASWEKSRLVVPVMRASVYGGLIESDREITGSDYCRCFPYDDPRRPVVMRGALARLIWRYSRSSAECANGWCIRVAGRYLRKIKYTCFDFRECDALLKGIYVTLNKKHGLSYHFLDAATVLYGIDDGRKRRMGQIWLNGKIRYRLTRHQISYIKRLCVVAGKIERLGCDA